jgi:hypothetical protein
MQCGIKSARSAAGAIASSRSRGDEHIIGSETNLELRKSGMLDRDDQHFFLSS